MRYIIDLGSLLQSVSETLGRWMTSSLFFETVRSLNESLLTSTKLSPSIGQLSPSIHIALVSLIVPEMHEPSQQKIFLVIKIVHEFNFQACVASFAHFLVGAQKMEAGKDVFVGRFAAAVQRVAMSVVEEEFVVVPC